MQDLQRLEPLALVDQVVPFGDDVVHRAAAVAERDAAIHTARALARQFVVIEGPGELVVALDALLDRPVTAIKAFVFHETGSLAHGSRSFLLFLFAGGQGDVALFFLGLHFGERAPVIDGHDLDELGQHGLPIVQNFLRPGAAGKFHVALDQEP